MSKGVFGWLDRVLSGTDGNGGLTPSSKRVLALSAFVVAVVAGFSGLDHMMELFVYTVFVLGGLTTFDGMIMRRWYNNKSNDSTAEKED